MFSSKVLQIKILLPGKLSVGTLGSRNQESFGYLFFGHSRIECAFDVLFETALATKSTCYLFVFTLVGNNSLPNGSFENTFKGPCPKCKPLGVKKDKLISP